MTIILPDAEYKAFLQEGRFMIQRSRGSGRYVFYPRTIEPGTGANDLEWVLASGKAIVYSTTTIRPRPPAVPYNVALVELEEGPRMMTRIEGVEPQHVEIGMPVQARITQDDDEQPYVVFDWLN